MANIMIKKTLLTLCLSFLILSPTHAQAQQTMAEEQRPPIKVVASFTILADMVRQIGGDMVEVNTILGVGDDVHRFEPAIDDTIKLKNAEIIAINGLSFEGWMHKLIKASKTKARLLVASAGINPIWVRNGKEQIPDPHAWMSAQNAQRYTRNIAGALVRARPEWKEEIVRNATRYKIELEAIDQKARLTLALLPSKKRKLVLNHDAFSYLARDYRIKTKALTGLNSHDEASAKDMKQLIKFIKDENIKTVFADNLSNTSTLRVLAKEANVKIGPALYAGSLTSDSGEAPTYLEMMKLNIKRIIQSMSY